MNPPPPHELCDLRVHVRLLPECPGHALEGDVVVGGADAAGGDHDPVAPGEGPDLVGDHVHVVGDDGDPAHPEAQPVQAGGQEEGVGVLRLALEDLVAHHDDADGGGGRGCKERLRLTESYYAAPISVAD